MANPKLIEEAPLCLGDVKETLKKIESRDEELSYISNKAKEYLDTFVKLEPKQKEKLQKKLADLDLTRLKEEHIAKIVDFLPKDEEELKIVLQAYPLSMPKKDQKAIVDAVKEFLD
jgi:DNA-directed RNA polymerase subunit F